MMTDNGTNNNNMMETEIMICNFRNNSPYALYYPYGHLIEFIK